MTLYLLQKHFWNPFFVEFTHDSKSVLVGIMYRRPKSNVELFLEHFENILGVISKERKMYYYWGFQFRFIKD